MSRSLAKIANDILAEAKAAKLTELATRQIVKKAAARPAAHTELGRELQKLAEALRTNTVGVTVDDVKAFLMGVLKNAV